MIEYLIVLYILLSVYILFISNPKYHKSIFLLLGGILVITAGFREAGITNDYWNYINAYQNYSDSRMEPSFVLIAGLVKNSLKDPIYLFVIYAILGVSLKFIALKQLSRLYLLSALIYFSNFFLLHEMTQIRAGVASALLLLCIKPLYQRDIRKFLIFSFIAVCFHYSSMIILPFWFLNAKTINKYFYLSAIPIAYILALSGLTIGNSIQYIPIEPIQSLFYARTNEMESGSGNYINIFNSLQILRCIIALLLVYYIQKIYLKNKYSILLAKIYIFSLIAVPLFMDLPVLSFRASELLGIVEIILIPFLIYLFPVKKLALVLPISIAGIMLWLDLFYIKLIF